MCMFAQFVMRSRTERERETKSDKTPGRRCHRDVVIRPGANGTNAGFLSGLRVRVDLVFVVFVVWPSSCVHFVRVCVSVCVHCIPTTIHIPTFNIAGHGANNATGTQQLTQGRK